MSTNIADGSTPGPAAVEVGQLWHTIRRDDATGSWQDFSRIEPQEANDPGPFTALSCAGTDDAPQLHVVGIAGGQLWHTVRAGAGLWQEQFGHIEDATGNNPGSFTAVSCAASNEPGVNLQVVGIVEGKLWHTIRSASGPWQDFREIETQESNDPGLFTAVACADDHAYTLHVVGVVGGQLWHTIRSGDAAASIWQFVFGHVEPVAGNDPGPFSSVSCAAVAGELHVVGTVGGQLWHTIRHTDGSWQSFQPIQTQETNNPGPFNTVACSNVQPDTGAEQLHVVAIAAGQPWHTLRHADGTWQSTYGNVDDQAGNRGISRTASCAGVGAELHLVELI